MKIKKYILSTILLIMLVGIFVPVFGVQAADENSNYNALVDFYSYSESSSQSPCLALGGLGKLICQFKQILNSIIPLLVALGVVYFVWGVVQYVIADGEEAKKKGKDRIIYGIIGFAVIVGLWGLVNIIVKTFDLSASAPTITPLTVAGGATCSLAGDPKFQDVLCYITGIINNSIIPLIFALATVMFVWGVVQFFILNADEEKKREQGKQFMIWGIIALAVMLSVWGLVGILGSTFSIDTSVLPHVSPP
ncbi:pilin [Patescibacteria group bacterium]|nr:pilin [Patescibacteria group bacterium]